VNTPCRGHNPTEQRPSICYQSSQAHVSPKPSFSFGLHRCSWRVSLQLQPHLKAPLIAIVSVRRVSACATSFPLRCLFFCSLIRRCSCVVLMLRCCGRVNLQPQPHLSVPFIAIVPGCVPCHCMPDLFPAECSCFSSLILRCACVVRMFRVAARFNVLVLCGVLVSLHLSEAVWMTTTAGGSCTSWCSAYFRSSCNRNAMLQVSSGPMWVAVMSMVSSSYNYGNVPSSCSSYQTAVSVFAPDPGYYNGGCYVAVPARSDSAICDASYPGESRICCCGTCTIDCTYGSWSGYSPCSRSCGGGSMSRTRVAVTQAYNGGSCTTTESVACNTHACPVDCVEGGWSAWGSCSVSCGGGSQARTRGVSVSPANGGRACGALSGAQSCNTNACPGWYVAASGVSCTTLCSSNVHACNVGAMALITSPSAFNAARARIASPPFSSCSAFTASTSASSPAFVTSSTSCLFAQSAATTTCAATTSDRRICCCSTTGSACPLDCAVDSWTPYSDCTVSCGGGTQTRTRAILSPAANGGTACPVVSQTQPCQTTACPVDCLVNAWTAYGPCSKTCGTGSQTRTRTIARAAQNGGVICPPLSEFQDCNPDACPPPVNCVVDSWSTFGTCSCQTSTQTRTRTVTVQVAHGGAACPSLSESQSCTPSCPSASGWVLGAAGASCDSVCSGREPCHEGSLLAIKNSAIFDNVRLKLGSTPHCTSYPAGSNAAHPAVSSGACSLASSPTCSASQSLQQRVVSSFVYLPWFRFLSCFRLRSAAAVALAALWMAGIWARLASPAMLLAPTSKGVIPPP
jgi:hypothetical protein